MSGFVVSGCLTESVEHLGTHLTTDLSDGIDIPAKTATFVRQVNCVLFQFSVLEPSVISRLLNMYCLSL